MNNQDIINEERYQKSKRKIKMISVIVLIIGLSLGGFLIYRGISIKAEQKIKYNKQIEEQKLQEQQNKKEAEEQLEKNKAREKELNSLISQTQKKIDDANVALTKLRNEQNNIFIQDKGYSKRYNAKEVEITKKRNEISNLERTLTNYKSELTKLRFNIESYETAYDSSYQKGITTSYILNKTEYIPYFVFGGVVIFMSCIISFSIYMISKRREIMAFTVQQSKPIADELSKVSGNFAREIAKGIKEGQENAQVPHVVRCSHCGADNEIIGKTGVCEYCKSKISYND